ncbi:WD-40 repeat-containing protein [Laccaria bicolor S238N-H82]|uniref:WD-40 repeat-containing protein n=1 Tax=Laccaria bicolor (strain S238N-H82 / ATCC MYA-4686) TaxID=486041 RepID=B0D4S4_LACBS|nr:WD-40 repeat-containing protein [Laccaria bicolor S238N-H82]EDR10615.1 WD-40 repeat-containing protein [Laccaria bicolor S238N-H82]|eukprot:XP_001879065.1 WD-40 repeat-containing protein [Laccaria bicolor S238N-H82]
MERDVSRSWVIPGKTKAFKENFTPYGASVFTDSCKLIGAQPWELSASRGYNVWVGVSSPTSALFVLTLASGIPSGRIHVERDKHFHHLQLNHNMSNQPQNKKTFSFLPNSLKSFQSRFSSSRNAAQTQTGQSAHVSRSGTTSPVMSRSPSPEGHNTDVQSSPSASVAVVGSSGSTVKEFAKDVWSAGYEVVKILNQCSGLCPPLKTALSGFIECVELYNKTAGNHKEMERILNKIFDLGSELTVKLQERRDQQKLDRIIGKMSKSLEEENKKIKAMLKQGFPRQLVRNSKYAGELVSCSVKIKAALDTFFHQVFQSLPRSRDAAFTAAIDFDNIPRGPCTKDTRVDVIKQIMDWVKETDSRKVPSVYWLTGLAGLGKTTIAYTICEELEEASIPFVSFFCSRQLDSKNSKLLITTICRDLAEQFSGFANALVPVLKGNSRIVDANLPLQMEKLLADPWKASLAHHDCRLVPVVIVDALDESDHGTQFFQELLNPVNLHKLSGIKFLVTSRPEPAFSSLGKSFPLNAVCKLHEIDDSNVQKDIEKYLFSALPDLKEDPNLEKLASQAAGFFIYAATAVRFISSPCQRCQHFSVTQKHTELQNIVTSWPVSSRGSERNAVAELYQQILGDAFSDDRISNQCLQILHIILCAGSRISISVIASLSDTDQETVENTVKSLHAVLFVSPKDQCVYWYHTSFPDFIFTQERAMFSIILKEGQSSQEINVFCDKVARHSMLACQCFIIMRKLCFNICNLKSSFEFDSDVPGLDQEKLRNLPPVLQYASQHWATHLSQAAPVDNDTNELLQFLDDFLCNKLLFWIEAMNLIDAKFECASLLKNAEEWVNKGTQKLDMSEYLLDAASFSAYFANSPASKSTPHLYISALSTWNHCSPICNYWKQQFSCIPSITLSTAKTIPLLTITTTNKWVSCVALSGDGNQIVFGCEDRSGALQIWDAKTGQQLRNLQGHTAAVTSVAFSPNGNQIVSGSWDTSVRVWDAKSGYQLKKLNHPDWVLSAVFSPDGHKIVSGSRDELVRIWEIKTGRRLLKLKGHTEWVRSVAFSPNGNAIVSGSRDYSVRVWNAETGHQDMMFQGHMGQVKSVTFSPDGRKIVSGAWDNCIKIWDAKTGQQLKDLQGHTGPINSVAFSPNGKQILSGAGDNSVCVWDVKTGDQLAELQGHAGPVQSVAFSHDGNSIVSGSYDCSVWVWDIKFSSSQRLQGHTSPVRSVIFLSDDQILSGFENGLMKVWDANTGKELRRLQDTNFGVLSVAFSSVGQKIVSGLFNGSVYVRDAKTDQLRKFQGHTGIVTSVAFSPDGNLIASGSKDQSVRIWKANEGHQLRNMPGNNGGVLSVAFSPDGNFVVSGCIDTRVQIWNVNTGQLRNIQGHSDSVHTVAFSHDGKFIVSGSEDKSVRVWEAETGHLLWSMQGHTDTVRSVAFSPDSNLIVSGSKDKTVRIWDAKTGHQLRKLQGHSAVVFAVAFSSDGKQIISGSQDFSVRLWDAVIDLPEFFTNDKKIISGLDNQPIHVLATSEVANSWVMEEGWILSGSKLLIWIPPPIRNILHHPHSLLIISPFGSAKIFFEGSKLGSFWHECYTPNL